MPLNTSPAASLLCSLPFQFLFWLAVIVALKWPTVFEPPVWDAAFGLFPAAGALADSRFDLRAVMQLPPFTLGGPNCHTDSIVTWLTAVVLMVVGKQPTALTVLHIFHFCAGAWTLAVLHCFVSDSLGRRVAWLVCATLLACPLFRVQIGAMYFEIPLAACTISALHAFARGRFGRAIVWSTLAVMVKQSGVIVAGTLIAAVLLQRTSWSRRFWFAAGFILPSTLAAAWPLIGSLQLDSIASKATFESWWAYMCWHHVPYLRAIPDITLAFGLFGILGLLRSRRVYDSLRSVRDPDATNGFGEPGGLLRIQAAMQRQHAPDLARLGGADVVSDVVSDATRSDVRTGPRSPTNHLGLAYLLTLAFAGFFFFVPFVGKLDIYCLPRYFVSILPLVIYGLTHLLSVQVSRSAVALCLISVSVWFVANRDGRWYPEARGNNVAVIERTESYRWLVQAQQAAAQATADIVGNSLLLYGLPEHYFFQHPWMGYSHQTPPGGRCVTLRRERPDPFQASTLPDRCFVLLDASLLGGRDLKALLREAESDPTRKVQLVRGFTRGPYSVDLFEVSKVEPTAGLLP